MNRRWVYQALIVGLAMVFVITTVGTASAQYRARYRHRAPTQMDLVLEGGVAVPYGDLGADFFGTAKGAGAETGYDVGVRFRQRWPSGWALSPSFHYENFGDFVGLFDAAAGTDIKVSTSIYRWEVAVQYFFPTSESEIQPFVTVGPGLYVNRYRDQLSTERHSVLNTFNAFGVSLGGGIRVSWFELAAEYHLNYFSTARLPGSDVFSTSYDWNYLTVTAGFALPLQE